MPFKNIRQRASTACDECRRRKLRCDGRQPQCGLCQETGFICEVTERGTRGPKKGYMKSLKDRVLYLEALLQSRLDTQPGQSQGQDSHKNSDISLLTQTGFLNVAAVGASQSWLPAIASISEPEIHLPSNSSMSIPDLGLLPDLSLNCGPINITKAVQAEL